VRTDSETHDQGSLRRRIARQANQGGRNEAGDSSVALALAVGVGLVVMNATAKNKPKGVQHGNTIHVIEHATTDSVDVDAVGHVLSFANDVFDS
jgi:hypothetical protein